MHTLDITEIYTKLVESIQDSFKPIQFDPEPWSHVQVGHMELKPDAFTEISGFRYWIEMDRGSEYRSQLSFKMARYVKAYEQWTEPTFPLVVWVAHDIDRVRFIQSVVKRQSIRALFVVVLFDEAVGNLLKK